MIMNEYIKHPIITNKYTKRKILEQMKNNHTNTLLHNTKVKQTTFEIKLLFLRSLLRYVTKEKNYKIEI